MFYDLISESYYCKIATLCYLGTHSTIPCCSVSQATRPMSRHHDKSRAIAVTNSFACLDGNERHVNFSFDRNRSSQIRWVRQFRYCIPNSVAIFSVSDTNQSDASTETLESRSMLLARTRRVDPAGALAERAVCICTQGRLSRALFPRFGSLTHV